MPDTAKCVTKEDYDNVRKWQKWSMLSLYTSAILVFLSFVYSLLPEEYQCYEERIFYIVNVLQVLALLFFHGFALWASILHYEAGKKHFPDLLDNAFGTALTTEHSENYYSSNEVKLGAGKLAWNVIENCFFTKSIYEKMLPPVLFKCIFFVIFFLLAVFFNQTDWVLTILRLTVPIVWIKKAIVFYYAYHQFKNQFNLAYVVMTHEYKNNKQLLVDSVNILLQYESLKAWLNVPADSDIYIKERERLNNEFADMSKNFTIPK